MKNYIKIATLFVAAAISVAVVSCHKDKKTENENQTLVKSSNDDAKELLNRIYAFQSLRDDINSGAKSGESMTLEELRDNIDLTFNFEHSQHATPFDYATLDTFYVKMPDVDANGNVTAAEAIATYNAFETNLENLMANVDDDSDLAKNFSIKFPEAGAKSGDDIEVVFTRGTEGGVYPSSGPFVKGGDLYWGELLGYCEPRPGERLTDATIELTKKFQAEHENIDYLVFKVEYAKYTPYINDYFTPGYVYFQDTTMTCGHTWLYLNFGGIDEPCMSIEELNCEFQSIIRNVVSINGPLHYGPEKGSPYYECELNHWKFVPYYGESGTTAWIRMHTIDITYAEKAYYQGV